MEFYNRYKKYKAKYLNLKLHGGHRYSDNGHDWISNPKHETYDDQSRAIEAADRHYASNPNIIYHYANNGVIFSLIPSTDPRVYIMIRDDGKFAYLHKDDTIDKTPTIDETPARDETPVRVVTPVRDETIDPEVQQMIEYIKQLNLVDNDDLLNEYAYLSSDAITNTNYTILAKLDRGNSDFFYGIILLTPNENTKIIKLIPGGGNHFFTPEQINNLMIKSAETLVQLDIFPTDISVKGGRHSGNTFHDLIKWKGKQSKKSVDEYSQGIQNFYKRIFP